MSDQSAAVVVLLLECETDDDLMIADCALGVCVRRSLCWDLRRLADGQVGGRSQPGQTAI